MDSVEDGTSVGSREVVGVGVGSVKEVVDEAGSLVDVSVAEVLVVGGARPIPL